MERRSPWYYRILDKERGSLLMEKGSPWYYRILDNGEGVPPNGEGVSLVL